MKKDPEKVAAAYKGLLNQFVTSPEKALIGADYKKWAKNLLKFTLPIIGVFLAQLQMGVELKPALLVAGLALYGAVADLVNKWAGEDTYKDPDLEVPGSGK